MASAGLKKYLETNQNIYKKNISTGLKKYFETNQKNIYKKDVSTG
jgi:hypothetical protein